MCDAAYFDRLEHAADRAMALESDVLEEIIHDSVAIKAAIVNRDETEKGERRKLNFGHTVGHAVEKTSRIPHGEAVSIGMMAAARLSHYRKMLKQAEVDRLRRLLERFRLPTEVEKGIEQNIANDRDIACWMRWYVIKNALEKDTFCSFGKNQPGQPVEKIAIQRT
ncbi:MAG: hypothetical protein R2875_08030 [Desulfobacterales bacterium]